MVVGRRVLAGLGVLAEEKLPLVLGDGCIEWVSEFTYLGSLIENSGRLHVEVEKNCQSIWGIARSCLQGCQLVSGYQEECVQGLCAISSAVR